LPLEEKSSILSLRACVSHGYNIIGESFPKDWFCVTLCISFYTLAIKMLAKATAIFVPVAVP